MRPRSLLEFVVPLMQAYPFGGSGVVTTGSVFVRETASEN
jgi:hypothetical protein